MTKIEKQWVDGGEINTKQFIDHVRKEYPEGYMTFIQIKSAVFIINNVARLVRLVDGQVVIQKDSIY